MLCHVLIDRCIKRKPLSLLSSSKQSRHNLLHTQPLTTLQIISLLLPPFPPNREIFLPDFPPRKTKMHFSTLALPLFLAATTTAAPLVRASSLDNGFPITVWGGSTCSGKATTVLYMPTDGKCYSTSPVFSGNTDSFRVTADNIATLPAGCSGKFSSHSSSFPLPFALLVFSFVSG